MNGVLESIITQSNLDSEIEDFLSHHGVKGQRWGIRNQKRGQRQVDRLRRIASGKGTGLDKLHASLLTLSPAELITEGGLQGAAAGRLDRMQRIQGKIKIGKRRTTNLLARVGGVSIADINYKYKTPARLRP